MQNVRSPNIKEAVVQLLDRRPQKARFVPEIAAELRRSNLTAAEIEHALSELDGEGTVIVRENFCADPHLEGADLRIVALVDLQSVQGDPQAKALAAIDAVWQRWVGDYLANHRCT